MKEPSPEVLRIAELEAELARARRQLEDRKLVDRAKGKLMDGYSLREAAAYRTLQLLAMQRRLSLGEVARRVLAGDIDPKGTPAYRQAQKETRK